MRKRVWLLMVLAMLTGLLFSLTAGLALAENPPVLINLENVDLLKTFAPELNDPGMLGDNGSPLKVFKMTSYPTSDSYIDAHTPPGPLVPMGSTIYFMYVVGNWGDEPLTNVQIHDSELGWVGIVPWGTLEPMTGWALQNIPQTAATPGLHTTYATASGQTETGEVANAQSDNQYYTVTGTYKLAIEKTAAESIVEVGDTIHYTIKVWNDGDVDLTNVVLNDLKLGIVNQAIGTLTTSQNAANPVVVNASYVVTDADLGSTPVENTATADSTETDPVSDSCSVPVAAIAIDKTGPDTITLGQTVDYIITVQNIGSAALTNVVVSDPTLGVNWAVGSLAVGASAQQTFPYTVTAEDIPGPLHNEATVTASEIAAGPSDSWDSPLGPVLAGKMAGSGAIGKLGTSFMLEVVSWPGVIGSQASVLYKDAGAKINLSGKASYISLNPQTKAVVFGGTQQMLPFGPVQFKVYAKDNGQFGDIFAIWLYDQADNLIYTAGGSVIPGQISFRASL